MRPLQIALADDHHMIHKGIESMILDNSEVEIYIKAFNGRDLLQRLRSKPKLTDVVVLDIHMPEMDGIETAQMLKRDFPNLEIMMLSFNAEFKHLEMLAGLGVRGYVMKDTTQAEFIEAVKEVAKGREYYSQEVAKVWMRHGMKNKKEKYRQRFTERELEIIEGYARGMTTKSIAKKYSMAITTVGNHRQNIYNKMDLQGEDRNPFRMLLEAFKNGVINLIGRG